MTTETVLTDRDKMKIAQAIHHEKLGVMAAIDRVEQAVLQSPEVQALRKDAERYRWATAYEDNADELADAVLSCGADQSAINERMDAAMEKQP